MIRFEQLAAIIPGSKVLSVLDDRLITKIHYDSRKVTSEHGSIFFAIAGSTHDGHQYILECYQKGVRQFVVTRETNDLQSLYGIANILLVKDSVDTLQSLAKLHRVQFNIPVIGITGSNGKTITKEWLSLLLSSRFKVAKSPGSFNSQIGVPVSVFKISAGDELGIFEAGVSQFGEMDKLQQIIQPTHGILTNLGQAHDSGFHDRTEKLLEKLKLFKECKQVTFRGEDPSLAKTVHKELTEVSLCSWSTNKKDACTYHVSWKIEEKGSSISIGDSEFFVAFKDKASLENLTHCLVAVKEFGLPDSDITNGLQLLRNLQKRLYITPGINNTVLVEDYYNNDLSGLEIAIDFLNQYTRGAAKAAILSDFPQVKPEEVQSVYKKAGKLLDSNGFEKLIGIGAEIKNIEPYFAGRKEFYESAEQFSNHHSNLELNDKIVLLKGAREHKFERIAELLQKKSHHTSMTINLSAVSENLKYFQSKLSTSTKIMGMVKALAYGSGGVEVAQLLQFNRIDYLGVAYTDEGRELRENGIHVPIMVMNVHPEDFNLIHQFKLEAEIYSMNLLLQLDKYTQETQNEIRIHLKIDTGMNRLGFKETQLEEVLAVLQSNPKIRVAGVFSHLAAAEDISEDDFTRTQNDIFQRSARIIEEGIGRRVLKHILNSAGINRYPEFQYDMVRLGIGLYGIDPDASIMKDLRQVNTLTTIVSQIKHLKEGETVGYGRMGRVTKPTKTATIAIGYADGFPRSLGNGNGQVYINHNIASTIGNVCMDMTMIDVTGIDVEEGDPVEIFGESQSVNRVAEKAKTIPYEILTSISPRVKRLYTYE